MSLRPIQDRVLLEKLAVLMPSGWVDAAFMPKSALIVLPRNAKERPVLRCRVVAAGPEVHGVKAGDEVVFNQYDQSTLEVELDGKKLLVVGGDDLLGVVESA